MGSLKNRVQLQDDYECYFIIADLHMLTTRPEKERIGQVAHNIRGIVLDYLAAGIDPERSVIFVQSALPETYELNLLLEMLVTVPRLERIPSLKEMARDAEPPTPCPLTAGLPGAAGRRHPAAPPTWCRGRTTGHVGEPRGCPAL